MIGDLGSCPRSYKCLSEACQSADEQLDDGQAGYGCGGVDRPPGILRAFGCDRAKRSNARSPSGLARSLGVAQALDDVEPRALASGGAHGDAAPTAGIGEQLPLRPLTFLPASKPRGPPPSLVLTLRLSMIPGLDVLGGGNSRGNIRHRQPTRRRYNKAFSTSRNGVCGRRPPRLACASKGSISANSASVTSVA